DDGTLAGLVPDAPAQVQHERQVTLLGEAGGVLHRMLNAAGHRDTAPRVVRDLQPEQLRARGDAVEAGDVEQVVPRGDARDVRAVRVVVEQEGERRHTAHYTKVGGQRDRLRADGDRLTALAVVVQRHLVLERAVQVRVNERDPAVRRLHDDNGKSIAVAPVTVQI